MMVCVVWILHHTTDFFFFFSSRRRHTKFKCDWSSDVCSSDLDLLATILHWSEKRGSLARSANSSDSDARRKFSPPFRLSTPCRAAESSTASLPSNPRTDGSPPIEKPLPPSV